MPRLPGPFHGVKTGQISKDPTTNVRNRIRSALLMYANLAGVTRLPYGGALTLDALT